MPQFLKKLVNKMRKFNVLLLLFSFLIGFTFSLEKAAKSQEDISDIIEEETASEEDIDTEDEDSGETENIQPAPSQPPAETLKTLENVQAPTPDQKKKTGLFSLKKSYEIKEKSNEELNKLYQEGRREKTEVKEKEKLEKEELYLNEKKERSALREKYRQEKHELKQRQEARKEEIRKIRNEKLEAKGQINFRLKEIRRAQWRNRHVDIITSEEDPIYILDADILEGKTTFLKIKDIDLKYKIVLQNQTPKIVNSVLLIWERKIPFSDTQTIERTYKLSKPMIPYEKRVVTFNDLNSRREGEIFKVKVGKILFEDATQWKSPFIKENDLK